MTVYTAKLAQYPVDRLPRLQPGVDQRNRIYQVLVFTFRDGSAVYIPSHTVDPALLPLGASVLDARLANPLPDISRNAGLYVGTSSITEQTYRIVDDNRSLSNHIADKSFNSQGTLGITVQEYEMPEGVALSEDYLLVTSRLENDDWHGGYMDLLCTDIQRGTDVAVFQEKSWRLAETIDPDAQLIPTSILPTAISDFDFFFAHDSLYDTDPNVASIAYARIEETGEIYSYTGRQVINGVVYDQVKERGVLGTLRLVEAVEVDATTEPSNWPAIKEVPYIQGEATDLAQQLQTGTAADGRTLPAHWCPQPLVDEKWIDYESLARHAGGFVLKFVDPGKQSSLKKWIEKEILRPTFAAFVIDRRGRQVWTTIEKPKQNAPAVAKFTGSNIVARPGRYSRQMDKLRHPIAIAYGYSHVTKSFRSPIIYENLQALAKNPTAKGIDLAFKGIHPGIHTEAQIYKLAGLYGDLYSFETAQTSIRVDETERGHNIGDVVLVDVPQIPDRLADGGVATDLLRSMVITSTTYHRRDQSTTYGLHAANDRVSTQFAGSQIANIPIWHYKENGINIEDVPGVVRTGNTLTGSPTLALNTKYYFVDDVNPGVGVEFGPGWNPNYTGFGTFELWVYGPWINKSATGFDFTGLGLYPGGTAGTQTVDPTPGQPGYFGTSRAGGHVHIEENYNGVESGQEDDEVVYNKTNGKRVAGFPPVSQPPGIVRSAPDLPLAVVSGRLTGFPADISGSGGGGTAADSYLDEQLINDNIPPNPVTTYYDGQPGRRGGGGFKLICHGGGNIGAGRVITSGEPAPAAAALPFLGWHQSRPGPGQPGVWFICIDGDHLPIDVSQDTFHAFNSDCTMPGLARPPAETYYRDSTTSDKHTAYTPQEYVNMWSDAFRIIQIPADEVLQTEPLSGPESQLAQSSGSEQLLFYTTPGALPTNFNLYDYAILQSLADGTNPTPEMYRREPSGWVQVDWAAGDVLANLLLGNYRATGAVNIFYLDDRPAEGTYSAGDLWYSSRTKILWRLGPPDEYLNKTEYGFHTGSGMGSDGNFVRYLDKPPDDTWIADADRALNPEFDTTLAPGETSSPFWWYNAGDYDYHENNGPVNWSENGTQAATTSNGSGNTVDSVAHFNANQGLVQTAFRRTVWIYCRATQPSFVKVQDGGAADNPARQSTITIGQRTDFQWQAFDGGAQSGTVGAFSNDIQFRTQAAGVEIAEILLLNEANTTDVPSGPGGLFAPSGNGKPRFLWNNPADRANPFPGVFFGAYGENGTSGVRMIAAGDANWKVIRERELVPVRPGVRVVVRTRLNSTVQVSNFADQGLATDLRIYDQQGNIVQQNDVETLGGNHWFSADDGAGNWFWHTETMDILPNIKAAWLSVQTFFRGVTGQVDISEVDVKIPPGSYFSIRNAAYSYPVAGVNTFDVFTWFLDIPIRSAIEVDVDGLASIDNGSVRVQIRFLYEYGGNVVGILTLTDEGVPQYKVITPIDHTINGRGKIECQHRGADRIRMQVVTGAVESGAPTQLDITQLNVNIVVNDQTEQGWQ